MVMESCEQRTSSWRESMWENSCNPWPLPGHHTASGDRMGCGSGSMGPWPGRAVGSWSLALLQHHWGGWAQGADMGSRSLGRLSRGLGRTLKPLCASEALAAMAKGLSQAYVRTHELAGSCADAATSSCFGSYSIMPAKGRYKTPLSWFTWQRNSKHLYPYQWQRTVFS